MPYFRIDDKLHSHRKTMRCSVGAMGLWALAGSWCMDQRTDGWVPEYAARRLDPDAAEHAAELVAAGYWHPETRDGDDGWVFHEWDIWQHSADYIEERKRRNRERMRKARGSTPQEQREADAAQARAVTETLEDAPAEKPAPKAKAKPTGDPEGWPEFWQLYPRKIGKSAAFKAYGKALKATKETDPVQAAAVIVAGLRAAVAGWRAIETDTQFIPYPASWLNAARWEDETPLPGVPGAQSSRRATLAQCTEPEPHPRHQWEQGRNLFHCQGVE